MCRSLKLCQFMKKFLYLAVAMVIGAMAVGFTGCKTAKMRDADEAYDRGEYFGAEKIYRKLYNKYRKKEERWIRGEVAYKLGLCYKRLNQSSRAAAAFQNAIRYEYPDSMQILYLAQAQHMQGNWKEALARYQQFLELVPDSWEAKQGIRACQMAPRWKQQGSHYIVKNAKFFNSRRADFCPMFLDVNADQLYWTSSNEKATGTEKSQITGTKNSDIFVSKLNDKGKWQKPELAEGELNSEFDEGCTAFSPDGGTMYLAKVVRKAESASPVEIYTSTRSEAKWSAPVKLEITADTLSSYGDPAVSPDGRYLYFTSDMPGGQGKLDLWRINLKDRRGTLENLGDQINTPGNERFPYCRTDSILYFSSDGHAGFGGLDIFRATLQPSGRWFIENLGSPMNSSDDDFGITFGKGESGYFSSNRKDGRGYDHIYSFEKPDLKIWISGYVMDKDEEPVSGAVIRIVGDDGSNQKAAANADGSFRFDLQGGVRYVMLAGANGYLNSRQEFESDMTDENTEYSVNFVLAAMHKPQVIENIFYDFDKATLRPESKAALDSMVTALVENPYVTIEMAAHTDRIGTEAYNQKLSQRRAQSVVNYLIANGIDSTRLKPQGYGKSRPKVVTKRIHHLYPQFAVGDTLNVAYIDTLSKANQAAADQVNRRTEFMVLSTNFQPFADDLKRMQALQDSIRQVEREKKILEEEQESARLRAEAKEKEKQKAEAERKQAANKKSEKQIERENDKAEKKAREQEKRAKEKAKREKKKQKEREKREKEKQKLREKREKEKRKQQEKRDRERAKRLGIPYVPSEPKSAPAPADGENVKKSDDGKKPDDVKKSDDEKKSEGDEKKPDDLRRSVKHNTRAKEKQ